MTEIWTIQINSRRNFSPQSKPCNLAHTWMDGILKHQRLAYSRSSGPRKTAGCNGQADKKAVYIVNLQCHSGIEEREVSGENVSRK